MQKNSAAIPYVSVRDREALFGHFDFRAAPTPGNAERIVIDAAWREANIVSVDLPEALANVAPSPKTWMHRLVAEPFLELAQAWADAGVIEDVITWNGAFAARYMRGTDRLSAHAWGSAFDINAAFNPLGKTPKPAGERGSVWRLVPIAEARGWIWGGRWGARCDGMHFELGRLTKSS